MKKLDGRKLDHKTRERVERWLTKEYPQIRKMAREGKAEIFFADEASIRSDYHSGTTWALKGQTPVVKTTGARFSVNMISAVNARGYLRFMAISGRNIYRFSSYQASGRYKSYHNISDQISMILPPNGRSLLS